MTRKERKAEIVAILQHGELAEVAGMAPTRGLLRQLAAFLNHPSGRVRWRAVLALGIAVRSFDPADEAPREVLRSLFWSMNDESGNCCRMAPEAVGEILSARPDLAREFGPLLPQYLVEKPFETGTLWALCRMARAGFSPGPMDPSLLEPSLTHPHARRRGLAHRLLKAAGITLPGRDRG